MVSWDDVQVFLTRLNEQQAGNLPADWSYVLPPSRNGSLSGRFNTMYSWGNTIASSNANYNDGYAKTRDVGM